MTARPGKPLPIVKDPNRLDDRGAMGLPGSLVERLPHDVFAGHPDLFGMKPRDLAGICSDEHQTFARRYAAGSLLALTGDPRIRPDDPETVPVPAARCAIGIPPERVGEVVRQWADVGVLDSWIRKEAPRHHVDIEAFRIMRYPVTNLEYRLFLDDTGLDALPTSWELGSYPVHRANHPVWTVRPEHADAYAAWLADRTGRAFRLPTEAEWEYAAGGGDTEREFPWGPDFRGDHANTVEEGPLTTTPVGIYPAGRSVFGADDMAGNVEEFVADDYTAYPGGDEVADDLTTGGSYRVARGGSFTRFGDLARCARRHGWFDRRIYAIGFRLVEEITEEGAL
ncbi:formylglycine-generating enzyme family protein [Streptomyces acidiscabies]|uniref:formylglycine-generating enzyme family protein n=1 Tax=Streptomyces acidiscabies TaxID=42234 RepID=UPI00076EA3AB|nr:SUMF1/EgtB/PvdO family nonheme iron enzyme [Streptomyces acidiscabies]GAQ51126.1 serine/threonine-protein kinase pkn1 [Streptomyces acidiscabies]